ncbi:MAG: hypothetical protein LBJ02_11925, partial [Bifidobacteriaceae bacterium]|nr:hypothetical protein [Bifidobacteriaceae bacterium]
EVPFLFSVDPTQYPDVNPLLGARGTLTVEQPEVEASGSPSARASASPSETGRPVAAGNKSGSRLWLVVGLVGVIVATVVVVVVLVVSSRSKRKGMRTPSPSG